MKIGTKVQRPGLPDQGYVVPDHPDVELPSNLVLVEWDQEPVAKVENPKELNKVEWQGYFPVDNPESCGAGKGANCCKYLAASPKGFECARYSMNRWRLFYGTQVARFVPKSIYPKCQKERLNAK